MRALSDLGAALSDSFGGPLTDAVTVQHLREAVVGEIVHGLRHAMGDADARDLQVFTQRLILEYQTTTSQLFQDLWVLHELRSKQHGFFVEFGATDGIALSNTYLLEHAFAWSGLLAEPNPVYLEALTSNRRCTVTTDCIHDETGRTVAFVCSPEPEYSAIKSVADRDQHAGRRRKKGSRTIRLQTISLNDFLDKYGAPDEIDYLSIDTEGNELEILAAFDFGRRRLRCISVEHNYRENRRGLADLLTGHGYRRKFAGLSRWDDWYILP